MHRFIVFIENNLIYFVLLISVLGLIFPSLGQSIESLLGPLLALLMFIISLTFDLHALKLVLKKPSRQYLAITLVYGPMSIAGYLTAKLFFSNGHLATGQTLLGILPTDVSSPLLVLMARGNVVLAAVFNTINTLLAPFIVPFLFLWLTGIQLTVPLFSIILQLILIILVPSVLGLSLRTRFSSFFIKHEPKYAGLGSIIYLAILLSVIGPNAETIIDYGWYALVIAIAALTLNILGYLLGLSAWLLTKDRSELIAFLFTVSKKEFSIAAAFVAASGLPAETAIPATFFAVIQMITSPLVARFLTKKS